MSILSVVKRFAIWPFIRKAPVDLLGKGDSWAVLVNSLGAHSTVLSAGVGKGISFEESLVERYGCKVLLLDPSPTGVATMEQRPKGIKNIDFRPIGLAAKSEPQKFGLPDDEMEGSYRKAKGTEDGDALTFDCVSVADIVKQIGVSRLDLLKMDIEGFEYEVLDSIFEEQIAPDQICVEIHSSWSISTDHGLLDAYWLICKLALHGYRIVYNDAMSFTFVRKTLIEVGSVVKDHDRG